MRVICIQNLYKSTYDCDVFIQGNEYEIIEEYKNRSKNKMCRVKSDIILGDGGLDFYFDDGDSFPYYNFKDYFKIISE